MDSQPLVSVVMPVYNAASTVQQAVRSLLAQTYEWLDIVVIDDGSGDRSAALVAELRDPRVRLLTQPHRGLVPALQRGCAEAVGGYVARLDADDVAHPHRIARQIAHMDGNPPLGLLGTWAIVSSEGGATEFRPPSEDGALRRFLLWDNPFVHSSVMFRRAAYEQAGGYTTGPNEDYRLWVRIAATWRIGVLPEHLVTHRVHPRSVSHGMDRVTALRARLAAQWEAARLLGPWPRAAVALGATVGACLLAGLGGGLEAPVRWLVRAGRRLPTRDVWRPR